MYENMVKIFNNDEFGNVKQIEKSRSNDYMGFVYALEWGDAIKIGYTTLPHKRLSTFRRQAEKYGTTKLGKFAISREHTNYRENEKKLHEYFNEHRKIGTELFDVPIEKVAKVINENLNFLNESEAIEQKSKDFCDFFKQILRSV